MLYTFKYSREPKTGHKASDIIFTEIILFVIDLLCTQGEDIRQ